MKSITKFVTSVVILVLIVYGVLYFFNLETGELIDWIVGLASFLWLVTIVTVPWNAYFKSKEVLDDAETSKRKDILIIDSSLEYAKKVAKWSLFIAISLHVISSIVLYMIAVLGITPVGYFGAIAAALLTFLRPAVRFYDYLEERLRNIQEEFRYPREDVDELLNKIKDYQIRVKVIEDILSMEEDIDSWRKQVNKNFEFQKETLLESIQSITKLKEEVFHEFSLVREESKLKLDKLTTDSKVLDSVREIAGFIKQLKMG